jgi:hypothetical protein
VGSNYWGLTLFVGAVVLVVYNWRWAVYFWLFA